MEKDVLSKLSATQQTVGNSFKKMLGRIDSDLEVMAQSGITQDALVRLGAGFENIKKEGGNPRDFLRNSYITQNPYKADERKLLEEVDDGSYYSKFHPKYHSWFRNIMD